jgi:hypothetical protein
MILSHLSLLSIEFILAEAPVVRKKSNKVILPNHSTLFLMSTGNSC